MSAPEEGSPFRPLYDDKIMFNGQPIALVLAEDWETARFAASLVTVDYEKEAFVTDLHAQRDQAFVVEKPEKPRGDADKAFAAAAVRHEAEYFIPTEHHNPMELFASTVIVGRRRQAHGLRQDARRAERAALSLQRVRHEAGRCARHIAVMSAALSAPGLRPQYQVVLAVLARAARCNARYGWCSLASRCTGSDTGRPRSSALRSAPTPTARSTRSSTRRSP